MLPCQGHLIVGAKAMLPGSMCFTESLWAHIWHCWSFLIYMRAPGCVKLSLGHLSSCSAHGIVGVPVAPSTAGVIKGFWGSSVIHLLLSQSVVRVGHPWDLRQSLSLRLNGASSFSHCPETRNWCSCPRQVVEQLHAVAVRCSMLTQSR